MPKRIEIIVPRKGISTGKRTVQIDAAEGFTGTACQNATKAIEEALGSNHEYEEKPELYDTVGGVETISEGGDGDDGGDY